MTSKELIEQSLNEANQTKLNVEKKFLGLSSEALNRKRDSKVWSIADCFQHLLFTNALYLKSFIEIVNADQISTENSTTINPSTNHSFKHSFWGKFILYFVNPKTKMKSKTTKPFNPSFSKVESDVVRKYLSQYDQLMMEISKMQNLDLQKFKIPSPINDKIKYNLGDAIRIIVLHDQRHIQQAERGLMLQ